ncbi:apolipoprotein N-acyltransferase [Thalassotalea sediminis]|uniref:apolipoprotein N-acyltransferase n=1 Tax=Thalassotalea sediminis TaxID=1759089 RepID=UPI002573D3B2|nr:apolipoprotein N-acyltransferase [Thalassotalea sediminis]
MLKKLKSKLSAWKISALLTDKTLWISALLGALLVFAYAPFSQWWLTWLVLPSWLWYVNRNLTQTNRDSKLCVKHGFAFGFGWFAAGVSWVHVSIAEFGGMPLIASIFVMLLLCLYLALYPALALYLTAKLSLWRNKQINWWLLAPCWALTEYLRGKVLTGFPWLSIGYTQIDAPFSALAPVIGEVGISVMLMLLSAAIISTLNGTKKFLAVIPFLIIIALTATSAITQWVTPTGETKRIALIQGNIAQSIKWEPAQQWPTMLKYLDLSRKNYNADIIVWPESAVPAIETMSTTQEFLTLANQSATINNSAIITGIINYNFESKEYFNSLIVLGKKHSNDEQGNYFYGHSNRYNKNHLLPIGEFVPFGDLLRPLAPLFNLPMSSFTRGAYKQKNLTAHDINLLALICFEIAFADQLSANFANESNILLTVSNDAWFGDSHGPHQHMEIARMRALEFARPLIRATNTGVTAVADHNGNLTDILPQFEQGVLHADVTLVSGTTPYSRYGNTPIYLFSLCLAIFIIYRKR